MHRKVICLLFFALLVLVPSVAEDYAVQKGDTPSGIASTKKVPLDVLKRANPDLDWAKLQAGRKLFVPPSHVVRPGETLYGLSRQWGVDQAAVLALNSLKAAQGLKAGQTLYVPPRTKAEADPATPSSSKAPSPPFWPVDRVPKATGDKLRSVAFATIGEDFRSVTKGTVVYVGEFRGVGRVLLIQSVDKTVFAYGNFETCQVEFGQEVAAGQVLGTSSGHSAQRLHFFVFRDNQPLDAFTAKR